MLTRERKLLRQEISRKLEYMVNKESKENDFLNSSQILTDRQEKYLHIARNLRKKDNRKNIRRLPIVLDQDVLPHVNAARANRLMGTVDKILKDTENVVRVIDVHSYRTATPFYTNPRWTIDHGHVQNYSQHLGAILHTPRYIEYLKAHTESGRSKKSKYAGSHIQQTQSSSGTTCSSSSRSSRTLLSVRSSTISSDSQQDVTVLSYSSSFSDSKDGKSSRTLTPNAPRKASMDRSKSGSRRTSGTSNTMHDTGRKTQQSNEDEGKKGSESKISQNSRRSSQYRKNSCIGKSESESRKSSYAESTKTTSERSSIRQNFITVDPLQTKEDSRDNVDDTGKIDQDEFFDEKTSESEELVSLEIRLFEEIEAFLNEGVLELDELDAMIRFFETVIRYCERNKEYTEQYGSYLERNQTVRFGEFRAIVRKYENAKMTEAYLERVRLLLDKKLKAMKEKGNTEDRKEETSAKNFEKTMKRILSNSGMTEKQFLTNYEVKVEETEGNDVEIDSAKEKDSMNNLRNSEEEDINDADSDDFFEGFNRLFRNSAPYMAEANMKELDDLLERYRPKPEEDQYEGHSESSELTEKRLLTTFNNLFDDYVDPPQIDQLQSILGEIEALLSQETPGNSADPLIASFQAFWNKNKSNLNPETIEKMKDIVNNRIIELERAEVEEEVNNSIMMAFRNLFRNSVGTIKDEDLQKINDIMKQSSGDLPAANSHD